METLLKWKRHNEGLPPDSVSPADLEAFEENISTGPSEAEFQVDWCPTQRSPSKWNFQASFVFADYFLRRVAEKKWPTDFFPPDWLTQKVVAKSFRKKLPYLKQEYDKKMTEFHGNDEEKQELRLTEAHRLKRERRRSRRKEVHMNGRTIIFQGYDAFFFSFTN